MTDNDLWTCYVPGVPVPQGSKSVAMRGKTPVMFDQCQKLRPWRNTMTRTFSLYRKGADRESPLFPPVPLSIVVIFVMPRLKNHKNGKVWVDVTPDLDKLMRAVGDSLTQAHIIADDSDFCAIQTLKRYARDKETPGVHVAIRKIAEGQNPEYHEQLWQERQIYN